MIPILYEATETAFTSQGLGALTDAVSCKIARVINGKDELVMVYPNTGARYADLSNDRIILAQPEYKKTAQPYQIYQITKPLNGLVSVYARQVCAQRMPYIPVSVFSASTLTATLNELPQHLAEANPFTFWTNKAVTADFSLTKPASLGNVLGGMDGSILDVYGGEYEFDRYTIKLWDRRGVNSGVELRYAKNITDIEHDEDVSAIVTGVCPYWQDMDGTVVVLPELVVEGAYADAYPFRRSIVRDFSSDFDEQPTVADLRAAATAYVAQAGLGVPTISLKVSFEHLAQYTGYENLQLLETLNLGDIVSIIYEPLNVTASARIAKTTYDCLNEKYVSVQVGSIKTDLEQVISQTNNAVSQIKDNVAQFVPSVIATAVEHATEIITGVNGGYVVLHMDANDQPYELLIMNTPDIQTATNVWRFNQNGLGHSSTGYNGTYGLALTADGQIVADKITTGTLTANVIRAGIIQDILNKNSWNLETGEFNLTNARINISSSTAYDDLIVLKYLNNEITIAPEVVALVDKQADMAAFVAPDGITAYSEFTPGVTENVGAEFTSDGIKLYDNDEKLRATLDLTDGLIFYNANGSVSAEFPAHYKSRASLGTVTPYSSRGTVDVGGFYRVGSQCNVNFTFTASYAGTNAPRIAGMTAHPQFTSPLQAYDLTAGEAVGCYVNTSGNIYLSTSVSGHQYAIGGTFII